MPKYVMEYYIKFGIYLNIIFIIIKKIKVGAKKWYILNFLNIIIH